MNTRDVTGRRRSLIFFFKQKTAYEMRISDWSSDVCSSDLNERGARAIARHPPRDRREREHAALALIVGAHQHDDIFDRDDDDHRPHLEAEHAHDLVAADSPAHLPQHVAKGEDRAGADVGEDYSQRPQRQRTHEHTYELQSLMRISYP